MFHPEMLFAHISYTSFEIQMSSGNVAKRFFYAHTDFNKLEGTLSFTSLNKKP